MTQKVSRFEIRCTPVEKAEWQAKADSAGLTIAQLVRESMTRVREWAPEHKKTKKDMLYQIAKIGNNLNQLAHWVNAHKDRMDTYLVLAELYRIRKSLDNFLFPIAPISDKSESDEP
jgi:hypothetical protein